MPTPIFVRAGADRRPSYDPARRVRFAGTQAFVPDAITGDHIAVSQPVAADTGPEIQLSSLSSRSSSSTPAPAPLDYPTQAAPGTSDAHEWESLSRALLTDGVRASVGENGERDFALASQIFTQVATSSGNGKLAAKALRNLQSLAEEMNDDDVRSRVHRLADRQIDTDPDFAFEIYDSSARAKMPSALRDLAREKICDPDFVFRREQVQPRRWSHEGFERFGEDQARQARKTARRAARVSLRFYEKLQPYAQLPPTQRLGIVLGIQNYVEVDPTAAHHARRELLHAAGDIEQNRDLGAVGTELRIELERAAQAYPPRMLGGELHAMDMMDDINA